MYTNNKRVVVRNYGIRGSISIYFSFNNHVIGDNEHTNAHTHFVLVGIGVFRPKMRVFCVRCRFCFTKCPTSYVLFSIIYTPFIYLHSWLRIEFSYIIRYNAFVFIHTVDTLVDMQAR